MPTKLLFGWTVLPAAALTGIVLACLSRRIRDLFFVLLVFLTPLIERVDLNFVSREWYPGTSRGFEFSVLEIFSLSLLASSVLVPRKGEARAYWPASLGLMLLFFCYASFNVAISDPQIYGLFELFKLLRGILLFLAIAFYLRSEREMRLVILSLAAAVCYQGLLAFKERYLDGIHRVSGTLDDSNSLSVFFCTTAPFFVAAINSQISKWLKLLSVCTIALAAVAEILTISRAGIIIIAAILLATTLTTISWKITLRKLFICAVVLIAVSSITAKSWHTLKARFAESNLKQEYGNKKNLGRGYYIRIAEAIAKDNWLGVGLKNWSFWVSNKYGPRLGYFFVPYPGTDREPSTIVPPESNVDMAQAAPAHSLAALTVGELGIPGFVLLTLLWLRWFQMGASFFWSRSPDPMRRMGVGVFFCLCGIFLQSLTEWVFRHSPIYYTVHILLGALASMYYIRKRNALALALSDKPEQSHAAPGPVFQEPATA